MVENKGKFCYLGLENVRRLQYHQMKKQEELGESEDVLCLVQLKKINMATPLKIP